LSLAYALPITDRLNGLLTVSAETEQEMVAVERLAEYTDLPPQPSTLHAHSQSDTMELPFQRKKHYLWMESVMLFQSAPVSLCREGPQGDSTQLMLTVPSLWINGHSQSRNCTWLQKCKAEFLLTCHTLSSCKILLMSGASAITALCTSCFTGAI